MFIDKKKFSLYSKEVLSYVDEMYEPHDAEKHRINYSKHIKKVNIDNLIFCINKFISSELDKNTSGKKGVGRATDYYPRFAGYFYSSLKKVSDKEMLEIGSCISALIAKTYQMLLVIVQKYKENSFTEQELFEKWVINIYLNNFSTDLARLPEDIGNIIIGSIEKDYENIKNVLSKNKIKPGFFSGDKTPDILMSYVNAGLILCTIEL